MRRSKSLERLRNGEAMRTCSLGHYIPSYVALAARAGYDCIWLDLEHRAMGITEIQALLAFSHLHDIDIMLRPPTLEKTGLYRFLEDGAAGLLIPMVNDAEMAKKLVQATKFPPIGERGLDNSGLDSDYNDHDPKTYVEWVNRETFLAVQIETPEAVRNVDEIAAVEGVDIIFLGPGDLGLRLPHSGDGMTLDDAWDAIAAACRKHNKPFGGPASPVEEMKKRYAQGARLLANGGEFRSLEAGLRDNARQFDELT